MTKSRNPLNLMRNEEITEKSGNPVLEWKSEKSPYLRNIVREVRPVAYPSTKAQFSVGPAKRRRHSGERYNRNDGDLTYQQVYTQACRVEL